MSAPNVAAWKIHLGSTCGGHVAFTWRMWCLVSPFQHVAQLQRVAHLQYVAEGLKRLSPSSCGSQRTFCGRTRSRTRQGYFWHMRRPPWTPFEVCLEHRFRTGSEVPQNPRQHCPFWRWCPMDRMGSQGLPDGQRGGCGFFPNCCSRAAVRPALMPPSGPRYVTAYFRVDGLGTAVPLT